MNHKFVSKIVVIVVICNKIIISVNYNTKNKNSIDANYGKKEIIAIRRIQNA